MADVFELEIIRPTKSEKFSVEWIEVQSPTGNFVVGPDHHPLVSILKDRGEMKYKEFQGGEKKMDIYRGGLFKVAQNKVVIFLEE